MSYVKLPLLFLSLLFSDYCLSQSTAIKKIARKAFSGDLKKNLYYLCSEPLEGRLTATHGDTLVSLFIANWFKKHNLKAPYNGENYFQPVQLTRSVVEEAVLTVNSKSYLFSDGWIFGIRNFPSNINLINTPVDFVGYGYNNSYRDDFKGLDVTGKPVIHLSGLPIDSAGNYLSSGTKTPIPNLSPLRTKKTPIVFRVDPTDKELQSLISKPPPNPVGSKDHARDFVGTIRISDRIINEILEKDGVTIEELIRRDHTKNQSFETKNIISLKVKIKEIETEPTPNVIGIIEGTDKTAGHIIVMAHHDHFGKETNGDIMYGAADNASGTTALMGVAALFNNVVKKGLQPKRTIVFVSTTGEEIGLIGAYNYADHPVLPIEKTWALLNIDMVGYKNDSVFSVQGNKDYLYLFITDSVNHGLEKAVNTANESIRLKFDWSYGQPGIIERSVRGSDQYPFYLKGVPIVKFNGGPYEYYHKPTDTPDKIDFDVLKKHTQLAFLIAWNLANN